jgi:hypothetical protein
MKKQWEQPKLIVLVRGNPEESLIIYCKGLGFAGDPNNQASDCNLQNGECGVCNYQSTS